MWLLKWKTVLIGFTFHKWENFIKQQHRYTKSSIKILKYYKTGRLDSINSEVIKASAPLIVSLLGNFLIIL